MEDKKDDFKGPYSNHLPGHALSIIYSLRKGFGELLHHNPLILSSSVAFFTLFSLPPILIVVINLFGAIVKGDLVGKRLIVYLEATFGLRSAEQIGRIINNIQNLGDYPLATILGSVFLVFVGTTTFSIIHQSLNQIWQVKEKPKSGIIHFLKERGVAFLIILLSGILFLVSLVSDIVLTVLSKWTDKGFPIIIGILNQIFSIAIVTIWFAIIFKFLPNVKIRWKLVWIGAIVTGILFTIGKFVIGKILIGSNITNIYGAAGSIILVLLFLFYSSMILFYGASFMKSYASVRNYKIEPRNYSVIYEINEINKE